MLPNVSQQIPTSDFIHKHRCDRRVGRIEPWSFNCCPRRRGGKRRRATSDRRLTCDVMTSKHDERAMRIGRTNDGTFTDHHNRPHTRHRTGENMARPTPLAVLLLLLAAAASIVNGFVVRSPSPSASSPSSPSSSRHGPCHSLAPARAAGAALQRRSGSTLRMMGGGVEAVTPVLLAQLAGCAALVGTGKVLLKQEEEEGIEPAAPWAEGRERSGEVDLYRDTWVRYFGYFNEVGEAFRPIIPVALVTFSYLVAFVYILADSYSQGAKVKEPDSGAWRAPSLLAAVDSLFFQVMASVIFPSFTINRSVAFVGALVAQLPNADNAAGLVAEQAEWLQYVPTAVGLVVIPLICPSLDVLTHRLLDGSFRSASAAILRDQGEKQA